MPQDLPYELEELILSHIAHDSASLKSCSLACRRFSDIAQKRLFEDIKIVFSTQGDRKASPARFLNLLTSSSHISRLVQSISIVEGLGKVGRHTRLRYDTALPSCLPLLRNLRSINLESHSFQSTLWTTFSPEVHYAFANMFHLPSLVNVSLYRIMDFPITLLSGCVALEELSLKLVTFKEEDTHQEANDQKSTPLNPTGPRQRPILKALLLTLADPIFHFFANWLVSPSCVLDISKLQRLSVSMTMEYYDHGNIGKLLEASATSLEVFCFSPSFRALTTIALNPINLRCLSRLRVLRLRLGMVRLGGFLRHNFLPWILEAAKQLNSRYIEEISIKINLFNEFQGGSNTDMSVWSSLDSTLSKISSLRRVTLFIVEEETALNPAVLAEIRNRFPDFSSRGVLNVETSSTRVGFSGSGNDSL